jgi:hypothetical protein
MCAVYFRVCARVATLHEELALLYSPDVNPTSIFIARAEGIDAAANATATMIAGYIDQPMDS